MAIVKSRISPQSWEARVATAREDARLLARIARKVEQGHSLNQAIRQLVPASRRSWVIHRWPWFKAEGWEALIDERVPREPKLAKSCGPLIEAARAANPRLTGEEALQLLRDQRIAPLPSFSTIKLHFARADARSRYQRRKAEATMKVIALPFGGAELLGAAELETGGIGALTQEVLLLQQEALRASDGKTPQPDVARRDELGQFTVAYNRARKRKRGEAVASHHRTAEEKARGKVPSWPRFVSERGDTLSAKLAMLSYGWLVTETKGWDALRAPQVAGLEPLTGFAYLPSTLSKFTSALAQSNAGPRLLQRVGVHWHGVAQAHWDESGAMAALYVDNHTREVWSSLFTQSGKVSRLNRVMPCLTTTYLHTGAGTPVVASVQSGAAPLAPRLLELVEQTEQALETEVTRAVVIDGEGATFDILSAFTEAKRVIVTPLKPSRVGELSYSYTRGSYYRPYREHDQLRVGRVEITSRGRSLEVGALRVKRAHRPSDTVLLTNGLELGLSGPELADLYYARWPLQENAFKDGAAVQLGEHRGNCSRVVSNVAVVSRLEQLAQKATSGAKELRKLEESQGQLLAERTRTQLAAARAEARLQVRRRRLDTLIAQGRTEGKQLGGAAIHQQQALRAAEEANRAQRKAERRAHENTQKQEKLRAQLAATQKEHAHLEPQCQIRQVDVALDSVLLATKLTAAMLIAFVLREYLPVAMSPQTFVSRVLTAPGRKEIRPGEERVVLYENRRDPEVNAVLHGACEELNRRKLERDGRRLRFEVAPPN